MLSVMGGWVSEIQAGEFHTSRRFRDLFQSLLHHAFAGEL